MWRTKSSYTSEGWHRSIAGTLLLLLASASPPLRSASVSRALAFASRRFPFPRGRAFLSSWAGQEERNLVGDCGHGASRWFKIGCGNGGISLRSVLALGGCRLPVSGRARAGRRLGMAGRGCLGQRPSKMGDELETGDFRRSLPTDRCVGSGVRPGLRSQTAVVGEDRANGTVCAWTTGVGPNGSGCNSFLLF